MFPEIQIELKNKIIKNIGIIDIFYYAGNINKTPIFLKTLKYFIKSKINNKVIQQYIYL